MAQTVADTCRHDLAREGDLDVIPVGVKTCKLAPKLLFDCGATEEIAAVALLGRNPAGYDGEMIERPVSVQDSSRSVPKTQLHSQCAPVGASVYFDNRFFQVGKV